MGGASGVVVEVEEELGADGSVWVGGAVSPGGALGRSPTGTPVREWRRSGIVDSECESGDRMRRRRGLETFCCAVDCG